MSSFRRFTRLIPLLILWLMASALIWGFVFTRITDTARENKIVIFVDAETPGAAELETKLQPLLGDGIRMVQVHPFTYAMLDTSTITNADLYIVKASELETYLSWFAPYPDDFESLMPAWEHEGVCYGQMVYTPIRSYDPFRGLISFGDRETYYLCFGKNSLHLSSQEGAVDDQAAACARLLLTGKFN